MALRAVASPDELERFARDLRQFNTQLEASMTRLNAQFNRLGETWKDQEHRKFAAEYESTMRTLHHFMRSSDQQIPFLQRKARRLRDYLAQR